MLERMGCVSRIEWSDIFWQIRHVGYDVRLTLWINV